MLILNMINKIPKISVSQNIMKHEKNNENNCFSYNSYIMLLLYWKISRYIRTGQQNSTLHSIAHLRRLLSKYSLKTHDWLPFQPQAITQPIQTTQNTMFGVPTSIFSAAQSQFGQALSAGKPFHLCNRMDQKDITFPFKEFSLVQYIVK